MIARLLTTCVLALLFYAATLAQTKWYNPLTEPDPVIQNQGWTGETGRTFTRLPGRAEKQVRSAVWNLSQNAAGLSIHFYSNAPEITIRYHVNGSFAMNHMPATGVSGVDLYAIDEEGKWKRASGTYVFADTILYNYKNLFPSRYHKKGFEYRLYLPLYNSVTWLEIGVPEEAYFEFIPVLKEKPVIVYGTSIAQGGCASRPAMGWTNILSRKLDYPVINLAFSGNGPFEKEMVDLINEEDAAAYVFDCLPNMGALSQEEVYNRVVYGVTAIRKKHREPILLTDHIGYYNDQTDSTRAVIWKRLNETQWKAYNALKKQGIKELYYLTRDSIRFPEDGTVDYVHPNDLGMQAYADAYEKALRPVLKMPIGSATTTQPISQRREAGGYEWKKRHAQELRLNREQPPVNIIIGNSITHYWAGEPKAHIARGGKSWNQYLGNFRNMGFGWDRIENVLWRIYHGELDGFAAKNIVVMIGTNNIGGNTDEAIVKGIAFLLQQIRQRQPQARIKLAGIFPRRGLETRVALLNKQLYAVARQGAFLFTDPGKKLLLASGKIDESLFTDGLHPNETGYSKLAPDIAPAK
ncbi:SGNH/GDSL hydrolase family protein [Niabella drilacis]|uniref:Lysophospholipase L1 n=1 Tax=Niabella drilacis (strain DSM 25811 / CCM 8410 / CCUG 62505 / LMG 26954 / E90) TaxID=1285928 RepID=A0A1G6NK35_NIADE|nr:SGNH/GDSL hydrolase family protein [Niabella drilacis]SDC68011.1 Lysophospholipase L1 [Niabella drilacis]